MEKSFVRKCTLWFFWKVANDKHNLGYHNHLEKIQPLMELFVSEEWTQKVRNYKNANFEGQNETRMQTFREILPANWSVQVRTILIRILKFSCCQCESIILSMKVIAGDTQCDSTIGPLTAVDLHCRTGKQETFILNLQIDFEKF